MFPTAIAYSSHARSDTLHRVWIVERALRAVGRKTLLHLTFSSGTRQHQEEDWRRFLPYYDRFRPRGLEPIPFYWDEHLSGDDVAVLLEYLRDAEVVFLSGGDSRLGHERFLSIGAKFYGDAAVIGKALRERQKSGKLTVGFSAGASLVCHYLTEAMSAELPNPHGFGLLRNIMCTLHHERGREPSLKKAAHDFPRCRVFGLPNDAGIAVDEGKLPSGKTWQAIEFIVDKSYDAPDEQWHIKTRQGMGIDHFYADGRHWAFNGGERIVRILSGGDEHGCWLEQGGAILDFRTQQPSDYTSLEEVLAGR